MDKIKVKPAEGMDFKEVEVVTKNWNLKTRKKINKLITLALTDENETTMFDACCDILEIGTTLTEDEMFNLSSDEIQTIGIRIAEEINKKK